MTNAKHASRSSCTQNAILGSPCLTADILLLEQQPGQFGATQALWQVRQRDAEAQSSCLKQPRFRHHCLFFELARVMIVECGSQNRKRLDSNREAARRCRERKAEYTKSLEEKVQARAHPIGLLSAPPCIYAHLPCPFPSFLVGHTHSC